MENNRGRYLMLTSGLQINIHRHVHMYTCTYKKNQSIQDKKVEYIKKTTDKKQVKYKKFNVHYIKQETPQSKQNRTMGEKTARDKNKVDELEYADNDKDELIRQGKHNV